VLSFQTLLLGAVQTLLVLLGLTLLYGQALRYVRRLAGWRRDLAAGAGFGAIAIGAMLVSIDLGGGILADLRNVAVAGSALFAGPLATLVAAVIAGAFRAAIGTQVIGALLGISGAALLGIAVRLLYVAPGRHVGPPQVVGFGLALAAMNATVPLIAAAAGLLPWPRGLEIGQTILTGAGVLYPVGLLILWGFLRLELARLDGERALVQSNLAYEAAVADRERADAALRDTQARFEAIMQHTPLIVAVKDLDGRYSFVNPAFERHFGITAAEILGKTSHAMTESAHAAVYAAQDAHVIATREPLQQELTAPAAGGLRTTLSVKFPLLDERGAVQAVGMIVADVTEQRRVDAQLAHAQRLQAVGQLTGGVAHDFNNLLTVVLGNAGVLAEEPHADPARRQRLAEMIAAAAERGAELTKRLLAFSRRQALKPEPVETNRLIRDMEGLLRRSLGEHIEIDTAFAAELWRAHADPVQVESAILNLAINARDAMPGGGKLLIETRNVGLGDEDASIEQELRPGDYVLIAVSDTGTGMPPEVAARAFEPFFTTKPVGQGSGLGLSMVYGFAKQSGGHVKIYSEPGHGTTVRLYLPRAPDDSARDAAAAAATNTAEPRGQETVLVVEDDPLVRSTVIGQLRGLGYQVIETGTGAEALRVLATGAAVDLMFTDVVMPGGLDGKELARRARGVRPGLKVLFTTGYTEDAAIRHGRLEAGARLLNKPYRRADLARVIRQALDEAV
jgi:PAS domain S-box-containing protein